MALGIEEKAETVRKFAKHAKDSGSTRVQVALITARLNDLQSHFANHKQDNHSRRGLLRMVSRRRRLLEYLRKSDLQEYRSLIEELGLRK
jgi:small subunit ribosomal protein S15